MKKFLTTAAVAASVAFGGAAAANASCDAYEVLDGGGWAQVVEQEDNVFWVMASNDYVTEQVGDVYEVGSEDFMKIGAMLAIHNVCFGIGAQTSHLPAPNHYDEMAPLGDTLMVGYHWAVETSTLFNLD